MRAAAARALPALLLLALALVELARSQPLWYDELYTAQVADLPLSDIARLARDGEGPSAYLPDVPPSFNAPYYVLVHLWLRLPLVDSGAVWLRLPSVVCAALAVLVVTEVVRRLAGTLAGVVAGLLCATSPLLLEQSTEARSYGPALLATSLCALGLVRWVQTGRGLVLVGVAGAAAGLLHWFALPAVGGLVLAGLLLRWSWSLVVVGVAAAVPTVALYALAASHGTRGSPTPPEVGWALPVRALRAWAITEEQLVVVLVVLALVALVRSPHRVLGACWLLVPLVVATAAEQVRPVFYGRYLLPGLLGLAVLAALGVASLRGRVRTAALVVALAVSGAAAATTVDRPPRERGDELVELLAARQVSGEPVVAADARAALALDSYVTRLRPRLRPDVVLPPDDVPTTGVPVVWLARWTLRLPVAPVDDDAILAAGGYRLVEQVDLPGVTGTLLVQRWER